MLNRLSSQARDPGRARPTRRVRTAKPGDLLDVNVRRPSIFVEAPMRPLAWIDANRWTPSGCPPSGEAEGNWSTVEIGGWVAAGLPPGMTLSATPARPGNRPQAVTSPTAIKRQSSPGREPFSARDWARRTGAQSLHQNKNRRSDPRVGDSLWSAAPRLGALPPRSGRAIPRLDPPPSHRRDGRRIVLALRPVCAHDLRARPDVAAAVLRQQR